MKHSDNQCFKYCVTRALHLNHNNETLTKFLKKQSEALNFDKIEFPVSFKDIDKFEIQNPEIAVNRLGYLSFDSSTFEKYYIFPLRISVLNIKTTQNYVMLWEFSTPTKKILS